MINYVYQLVSPKKFLVKYEEVNFDIKNVIVRPIYMSICHADQRYYLGKRDIKKLKSKLPMALIHESVGEIVYDPSNTYNPGHKVALIPNIPDFNNKNNIIYENYQENSKFLSSGHDGFMREFVNIPIDRVVSVEDTNLKISSICEFISVAVHATKRFKNSSHIVKNKIAIWGDGSLAYVLTCILRREFPDSSIIVIGKNEYKLSKFWFVDKTYISDNIPKKFKIDHAFECVGGDNSYDSINNIINFINPQGTIILLGVSENKILINTRDILEKGLTLVGSSRSGREDFVKSAKLLKDINFQNYLKHIIFEDNPVKNIDDIHRVFETDLNTPFKTIFKWSL